MSRLGAKFTFTKAPFRYLHSVDNTLDPQGPLSQAVPHAVINKVNRELKKADVIMKKIGLYLSSTAEKCKWLSTEGTIGVHAAV